MDRWHEKTFSASQIQELFDAIDIRTPGDYRDYTIILTLLDTGTMVSEFCHLKLEISAVC